MTECREDAIWILQEFYLCAHETPNLCRVRQLTAKQLFRRPQYEAFVDHRLCYPKESEDLLIGDVGATVVTHSKAKELFFVRLSVNAVLSRFHSSSQTLPPCSSAIRRARVTREPVPLGFPAVTNASNNVVRTESGMPGPLSKIVM